MKKVLTIDFDIIMAPGINSYNKDIPACSIEELALKNKEIEYQSKLVDFSLFQRLTLMLLKIFSNIDKEKIHFIEHHDQLYQILQDKEQIDLTNIDFHHDIAYLDADKDQTKFIDEVYCGNWVKAMKERGIIRSYTWVTTINSEPIDPNNIEFLNHQYDIESWLNSKSNYDYDEVFICLSPPWVPHPVHHLFFIWMDIANQLKNTKYEFETGEPEGWNPLKIVASNSQQI